MPDVSLPAIIVFDFKFNSGSGELLPSVRSFPTFTPFLNVIFFLPVIKMKS